MRGLILALMLPSAAMAQSDILVCRTAIETLVGIAERLERIQETETDLRDDLLELADRIEGYESASLRLKANRHHSNADARLQTAMEITETAIRDIAEVCGVSLR